MAGRFGKYGDFKRKQQIRKNRLTPPVPKRVGKNEPLKNARKKGRAGPERHLNRGVETDPEDSDV
jgi:hypothetical protein